VLQFPKRCVFKDRLKESKESPGRRSPGGRSFHIRGPAAEKLLLPRLLCVRGTSSFQMLLKRDFSGRRPVSDRRWQSSARYAGAAPASDWCTSPAILNVTRWRTGNQCSCRNTGVMSRDIQSVKTKIGWVCPFSGDSWVPIKHKVAWAEAYLRTKWHLSPSNHLATTDIGRKLGGW